MRSLMRSLTRSLMRRIRQYRHVPLGNNTHDPFYVSASHIQAAGLSRRPGDSAMVLYK